METKNSETFEYFGCRALSQKNFDEILSTKVLADSSSNGKGCNWRTTKMLLQFPSVDLSLHSLLKMYSSLSL